MELYISISSILCHLLIIWKTNPFLTLKKYHFLQKKVYTYVRYVRTYTKNQIYVHQQVCLSVYPGCRLSACWSEFILFFSVYFYTIFSILLIAFHYENCCICFIHWWFENGGGMECCYASDVALSRPSFHARCPTILLIIPSADFHLEFWALFTDAQLKLMLKLFWWLDKRISALNSKTYGEHKYQASL